MRTKGEVGKAEKKEEVGREVRLLFFLCYFIWGEVYLVQVPSTKLV